jgi:hypothetical protein
MRRQRSHWAVLLVALAGFVLTFCAFYPGLMSPDSSHQFSQAQRFKFADGHPVVMALIWAGTLLFARGPGGFFLLLLLLYWGGFFLVSRYFVERSRPGLWAAAAVPFLPFVINFSGTLWKDALVFDCFLVAFAIVLHYFDRQRRVPAVPFALVLLLVTSDRWPATIPCSRRFHSCNSCSSPDHDPMPAGGEHGDRSRWHRR